MEHSRFNLFLLALFIFSVSFNLSAQKSDSIMLINRKYKHEVGIDVQGLIQRNLGSTLILKIKRKENLVNLTGSKNFRFQLNLSGSFPVSEKTTQFDTLSGPYYNTKSSNSFVIQPMVGLERIKFYGKFNFYYGVDFGPYYSYNDNGYSIYKYYYNNNNNGTYSYSGSLVETESKKYGLSIAPFIGIKYRISSHFSASLESGFYLSYFLTKEKYNNIGFANINPSMNGSLALPISEKTSHGFDFSMKYLRFLTINYHL